MLLSWSEPDLLLSCWRAVDAVYRGFRPPLGGHVVEEVWSRTGRVIGLSAGLI